MRHPAVWRSILTAAAVIGSALTAAAQPRDQGAYLGVSRPAEVRELAFSVRGKVGRVTVKPGDRVDAGEPLISLDDRVQRANHALAKAQAEDTTSIELGELAVEFQREELAITRESASQGGANAKDVREAEFAFDRATVELMAARNAHEQRQLTLEREAARLAELHIAAPIAGDVVEVHKDEGETVDELTTVVTLVDTSRLEIDFPVPPSVAAGLSVGDTATVVWQDIEADPATDARIVFIPATGDPTVREVTIRIEVPNPAKLPSGLHARITFNNPDGTSSGAAPAANR